MPNPQQPRILLVEDEPDIAEFVAMELEVEGFDVTVEPDGMRGLSAARKAAPDLIILDRMLPGLDGMAFLRRLRESSDVPVLMLTALGQVRDRVEGLDAGANDYLAKPFAIEELLARVRALVRSRKPVERSRFAQADLVLDAATREAWRGDRPIELTAKEFDLLHYMIRHPRQVLTRPQILEAVWGYDFGGEDNVLEVTVSNVRAKMEHGGESRLIQTVRGVGYALRA